MLGDDYQANLKREGVVVLPTPLSSPARRAQMQAEFVKHICESPEFANPTPEDPTWKGQLGGFSAMANPSSFHHEWVRRMREQIMATVLDVDAIPIEGRKLEQTFDRLLYRVPNSTPTAESMHRDEAKMAQDGDTIFGGWVNIDDAPQFFSCCPRTHTDVGGQNKGFAKIDKIEYESFRMPTAARPQGWVVIEIPPGACLIFYERLVHEVVCKATDHTMMRMFLGWRVTDADEPLFGTALTTQWIRDQGVPMIKSGQKPRVWPSNYSNFPRNFETLTDWSRRTFVPACLSMSDPVSGTGPAAGTTWIRVKSHMLSLRSYGLPMHPTYDAAEIAVLCPQRAWRLYTFASPDVRVHYRSLTTDEWRSHESSLRAALPGDSVLRPRPESSHRD